MGGGEENQKLYYNHNVGVLPVQLTSEHVTSSLAFKVPTCN